jgi:hypothetical protein
MARTGAWQQHADVDHAEYLDRHGVTAYMKDVVTLLLENRPASPIAFISKYFLTVTQGSSPLLRAYRYIQLTAPHRSAFVDNLVAAYATLDSRRGASHVTGADLLRLLRLLCVDCPFDVSASLLQSLDRTESEPISFDEFSAAVRAGLLYDQLFRRARALFAACDPHSTGTVPRSVLQLALRQVRGEGVDASASGADAKPDAGAAGGGSGGGGGSGAALQRLQREVQCEVAQLSLSDDERAGSGGRSPPTLRSNGAAAGAPVTLDEFLRASFAASLGPGQEAAVLTHPPASNRG